MMFKFQSVLASVPIATPISLHNVRLKLRLAVDAVGKIVVQLSSNGQRSGQIRTPCSDSSAHMLYDGIFRRSIGCFSTIAMSSLAVRFVTMLATRFAMVFEPSQYGNEDDASSRRQRY
jgi:hypothetical protein